MKLLDFLQRERIVPDLGSRQKDGVLLELSEVLVATDVIKNSREAVQVLQEREKLGSTGIGEGIAIPHGKLKDLDQLVLSFGRSSQGVDFESMDGKPVHLFFLLVAPENCAGIHLRALAKIARLLKNSAIRKKLGSVVSREEIYSIIREEDEDF